MRHVENYTAFQYDQDIDLDKTDYWILCATDTPPGRPRTPMADWFFMHCSNIAASYASEKIAIPTSKSLLFRSYNGYSYMTVELPQSEREIRMRSEIFRNSLDKIIHTYRAFWQEGKSRLITSAETIKAMNFKTATWYTMGQLLQERITTTQEMYERTFYLSQSLGTIYLLFLDLCENMLGLKEYSPAFQKLFVGLPLETSLVEKDLLGLAQTARDLSLENILHEYGPQDVLAVMDETKIGKRWNKKFREFLDLHGWRCRLKDDFITPMWIEEPGIVIEYIQKYASAEDGFIFDRKSETQPAERKRAQDELIQQVPVEKREWFGTVLQLAQDYTVWKIEHNIYCEMLQSAITRHTLLNIGRKLYQTGSIRQAEDIFFLIPEEVMRLLNAPEASNLNITVSKRRAMWEENKNVLAPPLFTKIRPDQAVQLLLKSKNPAALELAIGMTAPIVGKRAADLRGQAASIGMTEGIARVINSVEELNAIQKDEIVIAQAIDANWSTIFPIIKGAVIEQGGMLSDAAILGREYGIPVITNVKEATKMLKTGQHIKLDGNLGAIRIVQALNNKKLLLVDDEVDIIETLEELLTECEIKKATTFTSGKELLEQEEFDVAILDIMGVDGYSLLKLAHQKNIITIMLTAHALTLDDTVRSFKEGAAYFVPKEKIIEIPDILSEAFENAEKGKLFWSRWYERFAPYYDQKFGHGWQNKHKEFWEIFRVDNLEKLTLENMLRSFC